MYRSFYFMLLLHDIMGRVVWIEHHPCRITSIAFSDDCSRALAGNDIGELFVYDLSQLIPVASPPPPPLPLPEWTLRTPSMGWIQLVSFTNDCRGIITNRSHAFLSPQQRPLRIRSHPATPAPSAAYFLEDGWLWRIDLDSHPRRLCWIPLPFRPLEHWNDSQGSWSPNAHIIAIRTQESRLLILDALHC
ncbi:hypothetical protein C8Q73DRAFT_789947 [Cubamyces lactineus]|nr:hypothetical protein C8Q73DRAFT_789947 [Cubamyces lactineus]